MTKTHNFPAGKYYVGDPCYAVKDENWSNLCDDTGCFGIEQKNENPFESNKKYNWDDGLFEYNGKKCFADGTAYGDGSFMDNYHRVYGVDAGMIGILPIEVCDGDSMDCGNIIEFNSDFVVYAYDGQFFFGNVEINTGYDEEQEDECFDCGELKINCVCDDEDIEEDESEQEYDEEGEE